jgi:hypothetical protein
LLLRYYYFTLHARVVRHHDRNHPTLGSKVAATISLLLWLSVGLPAVRSASSNVRSASI